jgi:hypothetical protein
MNESNQLTWEQVAKKRARALLVFTCDPKIRAWLEANDPKALEQAINALVCNEEHSAFDAPSRSEADDFAGLFTDDDNLNP